MKRTGSFILHKGADTLVDPGVILRIKRGTFINAQVELHWYEEAGHVITVSPVRGNSKRLSLFF